jgi:hypothetical protein
MYIESLASAGGDNRPLSGKPARPFVAALQGTRISGSKSNIAQPCLLKIVSLRRPVGTLSYMVAIEVRVQSPIVLSS